MAKWWVLNLARSLCRKFKGREISSFDRAFFAEARKALREDGYGSCDLKSDGTYTIKKKRLVTTINYLFKWGYIKTVIDSKGKPSYQFTSKRIRRKGMEC